MMLQLKHISKSFAEQTLFTDLDVIIPAHTTNAIVGRSGSGKTTLLSLMAALDRPDKGSIYWNDECITDKSEEDLARFRNQEIGYIFQNFELIDELTVAENILVPASIARSQFVSSHENFDRMKELLDLVDLSSKKTSLAASLSGGEKQRVAIARAFINDPSIIFADEPTGNLDETTAHLIEDLLFDCVQKQGKTLVIVTHDTTLAKKCDHIFDMKQL